MPYSINITGISGGTAPVSFYVCDQNGNNCSFLGITTGVYVLPTFYQSASTLMIKTIDSGGCTYFKIITCEPESYVILTEFGDFLTTEGGDLLVFE